MDNDLISRSALLEKLRRNSITDKITFSDGLSINETVEAAPAVDAVEVVRCTECQYMKIKAGLCYCKVWQGYNGMGSEGFCSYGERRDDEGRNSSVQSML